jgi:hypothetical protein
MTLPDPIALKAALNQNCQLFVGEDKTIEVDTTGYDLAGATKIEWWMAKSPYSLANGDVLIRKSLITGITLADPGLTIDIDAADTVSIKPELYYHELKLTLADGSIKVAMTGNILVRMSLQMETTP